MRQIHRRWQSAVGNPASRRGPVRRLFGLSVHLYFCTRGQLASDDAKTTPPRLAPPHPSHPPKVNVTLDGSLSSPRDSLWKDGWLAGCTVCATQRADGIGQRPCKLVLSCGHQDGMGQHLHELPYPGIAEAAEAAEGAEHRRAHAHGTDPSARAASTARRYGEILHPPPSTEGPSRGRTSRCDKVTMCFQKKKKTWNVEILAICSIESPTPLSPVARVRSTVVPVESFLTYLPSLWGFVVVARDLPGSPSELCHSVWPSLFSAGFGSPSPPSRLTGRSPSSQ